MDASSFSLVLFILAGLSLLSGLEWLFVVFVALGLALLYYDRNSPVVEEKQAPEQKTSPASAQQVVIVRQDSSLSDAIADKIVEHTKLEHLTGTKREIAELKKKLKK
ncbi:MAG: hypothetical protein QXR53_01830 [Candidatus Norongarragalinales archaeon]